MSGKDRFDLVVVSNRLPVDLTVGDDGAVAWNRSPGGLVTALEPMMRASDGAWVGWSGAPDLGTEPFDADDMRLVPVTLSATDIERYYEGFSNDTLWPLYHDVIAPPSYHRTWWDAYRRVNQRFADAAAEQAAEGGIVWVHDYQLQLVPHMLRVRRPDLRIGFFNHIPFPPLELFQQLPWRRQVLDGLLGADLVGFQRASDASNFVRAVRRLRSYTTRGPMISVSDGDGTERSVRAAAFPISIDSNQFDALARTPEVQARAREIRRDLGDPDVMMLGVDRLDYTKGIRHRIKAYGEVLLDGRLDAARATLVQVASPSRENVGAYQELREQVEGAVGRINGEFAEIGHAAIHYLHHSYPPEEMAALYLAADVMLVTALRDGMNLVAKEYVAARSDEQGVLVLSEFTGAADELARGAVLVNPHDIDGLKDALVTAASMEPREQRKRMRRLRRRVLTDDVAKWSESFLGALGAMPGRLQTFSAAPVSSELDVQRMNGESTTSDHMAPDLDGALRAVVADDGTRCLVALDFDGTLAPLVDDPTTSRLLPAARVALDRLVEAGTRAETVVALVSGRNLSDLADRAEPPVGTYLVGSHGAESGYVGSGGVEADPLDLSDDRRRVLQELIAELRDAVGARDGAWVQVKPSAAVAHTRLAAPADSLAVAAAADAVARRLELHAMHGKDVVEIAVLETSKGEAIDRLRDELGAPAVPGGQRRQVRVLYAGDDTTDERAFAVLRPGDVGIKVGAGETAATHRVETPADLAAAIDTLARYVVSRTSTAHQV